MIATIETSNSIRLHHLLPDKAFIEDMKSASSWGQDINYCSVYNADYYYCNGNIFIFLLTKRRSVLANN
jgi:hypothetical protein